jgi:hypothetical protein
LCRSADLHTNSRIISADLKKTCRSEDLQKHIAYQQRSAENTQFKKYQCRFAKKGDDQRRSAENALVSVGAMENHIKSIYYRVE